MFFVLLLLVAIPAAGQDAEPSLTVGDVAPALDVETWVHGDPVTGFEPGRVYVIQFWVTWSRQSRGAFDGLSDLQERFRERGLTVLGVTDEEPSVVSAFLAGPGEPGLRWSERARYPLAADPDGSVHAAYLEASGTQVPIVFVVGRDGRIEWIGRLQYVVPVVEAVVEGRWKRALFPVMMQRRRDLHRALARGRLGEALEILDELIALDVERSVRHRVRKFEVLLKIANDPDAAYAVGRALMRDRWNDATLLNEIAWYVVDERGIETRDFAFAMEAAQRANALTGGTSAPILDTVARVYWEQGEAGKAISWQHRAVQQAVGTGWEKPLRRTLQRYERIAPAL
jgi:alkyl hydroperoxide reductase subunit AhpC